MVGGADPLALALNPAATRVVNGTSLPFRDRETRSAQKAEDEAGHSGISAPIAIVAILGKSANRLQDCDGKNTYSGWLKRGAKDKVPTIIPQGFVIDQATLCIVTLFVTATGGFLLLFSWVYNRSTPALAVWGFGYLTGAAGALVGFGPVAVDDVVALSCQRVDLRRLRLDVERIALVRRAANSCAVAVGGRSHLRGRFSIRWRGAIAARTRDHGCRDHHGLHGTQCA